MTRAPSRYHVGMASPDVLVVGAGLIGSSIAWRLAQHGASVVLADSGVMGGEASSAGAGMLAPGGEIDKESRWANLGLESLRLYPSFVKELEQASGLAIDYRACGGIEICYTWAERDRLEQRAAAQRRLGIASEALSRADLARLVPLASPAEGLWYPGDAVVDPVTLLGALRVVLGRLCVQVMEHRPVTRLRPTPETVVAETPSGPIEAGSAVVAAGAWAGTIPVDGFALDPTFPVKGHLVGYGLEPGSLGPILRYEHTYLLQRRNGFTVAGSTVEHVGFDRSVVTSRADDIRHRAARLVPSLASRAADRIWTGLRPATASYTPEVRRLEGSTIWLAYGHYRNGILLAPVTAARVASAVTTNSGTG